MYLLQDYDKNNLLLKSGINKKTIKQTKKKGRRDHLSEEHQKAECLDEHKSESDRR